MASFELENDSFYICTELAPRCYIVQKAVQIDRTQLERIMSDKDGKREKETQSSENHGAPPPPMLPYWFTQECRRDLLLCSPPLSYTPSPSPVPPAPDLKTQVRQQLEYYFSRENLIQDRYLRCQMDTDQWVSISIISGFRKIVQLTTDYGLILQALRESPMVEVDSKGEKVRPVCRRCTIILREVSENQAQAVEDMLCGGPHYASLRYGLNNSWYVTYHSEEETQQAYLHLQNSGATINGKPVCARIKTGGPPSSELPPLERPASAVPSPLAPSPCNEPSTSTAAPSPSSSSQPTQPPHLYDLGQVLAAWGFVPRATYRPGQTVVHVTHDAGSSLTTPTMGPPPMASATLAPTMPPTMPTTPMNFIPQQPIDSATLYRDSYVSAGPSTSSTRGGGRGCRGRDGRNGRQQHYPQQQNFYPTVQPGIYANGPIAYSFPQTLGNEYRRGLGSHRFDSGYSRGGRGGGGDRGGRGRGNNYAGDRRRGDRMIDKISTEKTSERHDSAAMATPRVLRRSEAPQMNPLVSTRPEIAIGPTTPQCNGTMANGSIALPPPPPIPPPFPLHFHMSPVTADQIKSFPNPMRKPEVVCCSNRPPKPSTLNLANGGGKENIERNAYEEHAKTERPDAQKRPNGPLIIEPNSPSNNPSCGDVHSGVVRRERARRWDDGKNEDERRTSESGRSAVSAISGFSSTPSTTPSTAYSYEEQSFPVLIEKKPEVQKPAPKPTFSAIAAGRRKPEPKKSYAQMLKGLNAAPLHSSSPSAKTKPNGVTQKG